jgi:hypothetical protein
VGLRRRAKALMAAEYIIAVWNCAQEAETNPKCYWMGHEEIGPMSNPTRAPAWPGVAPVEKRNGFSYYCDRHKDLRT